MPRASDAEAPVGAGAAASRYACAPIAAVAACAAALRLPAGVDGTSADATLMAVTTTCTRLPAKATSELTRRGIAAPSNGSAAVGQAGRLGSVAGCALVAAGDGLACVGASGTPAGGRAIASIMGPRVAQSTTSDAKAMTTTMRGLRAQPRGPGGANKG